MMLVKKRNTRGILISILFLVFASILVVVLLSGRATSATDYNIRILNREQTADDHLPEELALSITNLNLSTIRLLSQEEDKAYWVANNHSGELCIVSAMGIGTDEWISGISCSHLRNFRRHGVGVTLIDEQAGRYQSAVILPDGYGANLREILPEAFVTENLAVFKSIEAVQSLNDRQTVIIPSDVADQEEIELIFP